MRILFIISFFISSFVFAQSESLAKQYFDEGDFEKALYEYKKLHSRSSSNQNYISKIVASYQQLENYQEAESFLVKLLKKYKSPSFLVELGYNYQLQKDKESAYKCYNKAIESLGVNFNFIYVISKSFEKHALINEAVRAYEKAIELNPKFDFSLQLAKLYGEQGEIEKMFDNYIKYALLNPSLLSNVQRFISDFISEDGSSENNILLKRILLGKLQQEPYVFYNKMLSWLFIQQKDYRKAFVQEKAIYKRALEGFERLEELAQTLTTAKEFETAKSVYNYIIDEAKDIDTFINANSKILDIRVKTSSEEDYKSINSKYLELLDAYGTYTKTLDLQISYAHFLAFYMQNPKEASEFLEKTLQLPLTKQEQAEVKLELGDILVLQERFNTALIYYSQIQKNLKNSPIAQIARFKVAKCSYYKGDFKWAESQLKILKSSTSQLIANDALALKLLISDNKEGDSLQTALKLYAKADLLEFQNKRDKAIEVLQTIINNHKTESIIPQALFKQAELFEAKKAYSKAQVNYEFIISNFKDSILMDDVLYKMALIYENQFNTPEEAKKLYEQIIFNHADSIYFIDARKHYRKLRGDAIN